MYEEKVRKFKCYYCPDCKLYAGSETKIVHGRRMKPNTKYCTGGKKIIIFRSDDPKVNVPKWCPKLRVPPTLRIYHFRSPGIEAGESMLAANGISFFPYPSRYAVRYEGESPYTAMEFAKQIKNHSLAELLSMQLYSVTTNLSLRLNCCIAAISFSFCGSILLHISYPAVLNSDCSASFLVLVSFSCSLCFFFM